MAIPCSKKLALFDAYEKAAHENSDTVIAMGKLAGTGREFEFENLKTKVAATRIEIRKYAEAYERHRKEHGC
jgi:hypothetical protein